MILQHAQNAYEVLSNSGDGIVFGGALLILLLLPVLYFINLRPDNHNYKRNIRKLGNDDRNKVDWSGTELGTINNLKCLENFNSIRVLDVSRNKRTCLPKTLPPLLETLHLGWNRLSKLPVSVTKLEKLTWLHVANNPIKKIPKRIKRLTNLQQFFVWSCGIEKVPDEIGNLGNLEVLDVSHNAITHFPRGVLKLQNLKWLDINNNRLTEIPEQIASLQFLESLRIHKNMLETIPDAVGRLSNLTELNVSNNQLTAIPVFIVDNLTKLKIFDIRHNQITHLPSLQKLVQLKKFDFVKNPLQEPPLEVCELGVEAILQYQHDMKLYDRIGARYGRRQVVFVVGESEVGKTSFCESLRLCHAFVTERGDYTTVVNESFISDGNTVFNFWDFGGHEMYKVICPLLLRQNAVVILMFDLSKYDCTCTTNAYLNSIGFWILKLQSRIPGVKVMIVGSKSDLLTKEEIKSRIQHVTERVNHYQEQVYKKNIGRKLKEVETQLKSKRIWKREERQKLEMKRKSLENKLDNMLCINKKFFTISSLKYHGILEIRKELQGIANENALLLPPNWVEFADEVMKHKTKAQTEGNLKPQSLHMSVGDAYRIWEHCNGYRTTQRTWFQPLKDAFDTVSKFIKTHSKKKAFETQLDFLHKWGCILWHRQNSRLCDSVIHDTGRMIDFLKRVFDYKLFETLKEEKARGLYTCTKTRFDREMHLLKKGVLIPRLMANILADFEDNEQDFLFSLLQEFDLCYQVRFGKGTQGLYFPWYLFKQEEPEDLPHVWPSVLEDDQIQLQVEFHFLIVVPISYFEKLQGRLHCRGCSFEDSQRRDWCNGMFTRYGSSRILIRRDQGDNEGKIEVAVRGKIVDFEDLWKILCWIYTEVQDLLTEYPGETADVIYLCPACIKEGSKEPLTIPWDTVTTLPAFASFRHCIMSNTVACHGQANAPQIPAAFHYPVLSSKGCCKQLREYEKICKKKCAQKDQVKKGCIRKKNSKRGKKATVVNLKEEHHHQHNETINISGSNGVHIGDTNITNVQQSEVTTS